MRRPKIQKTTLEDENEEEEMIDDTIPLTRSSVEFYRSMKYLKRKLSDGMNIDIERSSFEWHVGNLLKYLKNKYNQKKDEVEMILCLFRKLKNNFDFNRPLLQLIDDLLVRIISGENTRDMEYFLIAKLFAKELVDFHWGFSCILKQLVGILNRLVSYVQKVEKTCSHHAVFRMSHFYIFKLVGDLLDEKKFRDQGAGLWHGEFLKLVDFTDNVIIHRHFALYEEYLLMCVFKIKKTSQEMVHNLLNQ